MYSATEALRIPTVFNTTRSKSLSSIFKSLQESFSDSVSLVVQLPANVYMRTELLCNYISEEVDTHFSIFDFIMLLYNDFIYNSIEKYDVKKIYEALKGSDYKDTFIISIGNQEYEVEKNEHNKITLQIKMAKVEAQKGSLLLAEISDFYRHNLTIDDMVTTLWLNFIED
jgi:hypothetical protein